MTTRVFTFAALALATLAGCASPAGEWVLREPRASGLTAEAIEVDMRPGGVAVATIVRGGIPRCPERYTHAQTGRWFVNAVGELVLFVECDHEVRSCDGAGTNTYNLCDLFVAVVPGRYETVGDLLVSKHRAGVTLERPSR